jgi:hypothetical protein
MISIEKGMERNAQSQPWANTDTIKQTTSAQTKEAILISCCAAIVTTTMPKGKQVHCF